MTLILILLAIAMPLLGIGSKLAGRVVGVALGLIIGLAMLGFTALRGVFRWRSVEHPSFEKHR